jgi:phytoene synthase
MDPAAEAGVAQAKLAWWEAEVRRLAEGAPVHPIGRFLRSLPRAREIDFAPLVSTVQAAASHVAGAPLERGAQVELHSHALLGVPLLVAARMAAADCDGPALYSCTAALAAGEYLARAISDYRREAHYGRVPFAVDELLAADIENADLAAADPPPRLQAYLETLRARAAQHFDVAARSLPGGEQPRQRHLLVLAALGLRHLKSRAPPSRARFQLRDVYFAWAAARRAGAKK